MSHNDINKTPIANMTFYLKEYNKEVQESDQVPVGQELLSR